jgi:threonine/homoserine/homoserine lactone efflux protein
MISGSLLIAFMAFSAVALFTPGPNNAMLMASGLNYGFRRTVPHILGVNFGFAFLVLAFGFGLGAIFNAYPWLHTALKYLGAAYLLYLAYAIATSGPPDAEKAASGKPLSFLGAAAFQWVNVKGLVTAVGAVTTYAGIAPFPWNVLLMSGIFLLTGFGSSSTWALFGTALRPIISSPRAVRIFNVLMALALVASLYPVLFEP